MFRVVTVVGLFALGAIIGIVLTNRANEELIKKKTGWVSPMLNENNYTPKGRKLRRRANVFVNTYLIGFLLYFVLASHLLSCHQDSKVHVLQTLRAR